MNIQEFIKNNITTRHYRMILLTFSDSYRNGENKENLLKEIIRDLTLKDYYRMQYYGGYEIKNLKNSTIYVNIFLKDKGYNVLKSNNLNKDKYIDCMIKGFYNLLKDEYYKKDNIINPIEKKIKSYIFKNT